MNITKNLLKDSNTFKYKIMFLLIYPLAPFFMLIPFPFQKSDFSGLFNTGRLCLIGQNQATECFVCRLVPADSRLQLMQITCSFQPEFPFAKIYAKI